MSLDAMIGLLVLGACVYILIRAPNWADRAGYFAAILLFAVGGSVVGAAFKDILPLPKLRLAVLGILLIQIAAVIQWQISQRQLVNEAAEEYAKNQSKGGGNP